MKNDKIILASASPRRAELLDMFEVDFEIFSVNIDETPLKNEQPEVYVKRVAENKVFEAGKKRKGIIIGADTIVWKEGFLGKPKNKDEAKNMLRKLSASSHFVYSAVAIMNTNTDKTVKSYLSKTMVVFHELSEEEIELYIKTGEPMDKAGAYGIQGKGGVFIKEIQGSYYNVVGFPIDLVYRLLKDFGIELLKQS
jgi:septum formation protein